MKNNKTAAIIQARMGSTRLPGKVMKNLKGKPVLWHVIERAKQSKLIDEIIIATTTHKRDEIIYNNSLKWGVKAYRGSEENVLKRYYEAAKENEVDNIVRITSDCPLIDPYVVDEVISVFFNNNYLLATNAGLNLENRTYPRGLDLEVFSLNTLHKIFENANEKYQREHVTPYIYENYEDEIYYYKNSEDLSEYRLTLDTDEDYKLIKLIYNKLYQGEHNFYLKEIVDLIQKNPRVKEINKKIKQKSVK